MADAKLSALDAVTTLAESDPLLVASTGASKKITLEDLRDEVLDLTKIAGGSVLAESDPILGYDVGTDEPRFIAISNLRKQLLDVAPLGTVTALAENDLVLSKAGSFPRKLLVPNFRRVMGQFIELRDYSEVFTAPVSASGVLTLDMEKGNVFDVTLFENVSTMTISNPPPTGIAATGSFDLNDMAAADTLDTVTVNGVEILGGAETFNTDVDTTATNTAASITANSSTPQYTATATGAVVTIVADPKRGDLENTLVVATTETGFTVTNKINMLGGVNGQLGNFTMILRQDSIGSRTFAFASSIKWDGGVAPTITTAANGVDVYSFVSNDAGSEWLGFTGGKAFA